MTDFAVGNVYRTGQGHGGGVVATMYVEIVAVDAGTVQWRTFWRPAVVPPRLVDPVLQADAHRWAKRGWLLTDGEE